MSDGKKDLIELVPQCTEKEFWNCRRIEDGTEDADHFNIG